MLIREHHMMLFNSVIRHSVDHQQVVQLVDLFQESRVERGEKMVEKNRRKEDEEDEENGELVEMAGNITAILNNKEGCESSLLEGVGKVGVMEVTRLVNLLIVITMKLSSQQLKEFITVQLCKTLITKFDLRKENESSAVREDYLYKVVTLLFKLAG